jgi:hypothetical protein
MITEQPNFDLTLLAERFTTCGDYTREVILSELSYWQTLPDFLCLVSENNGEIDGFVIGYRNRNSLWIDQSWRKNDGNMGITAEAMEIAKDWARQRGMTGITGETKRSEKLAMKRLGFEEYSIIMRLEL